MSRYITPITEQHEQYRRGQVLGFTMAEIMLVILFLLLLMLGSQIQALSEHNAELEQVVDASSKAHRERDAKQVVPERTASHSAATEVEPAATGLWSSETEAHAVITAGSDEDKQQSVALMQRLSLQLKTAGAIPEDSSLLWLTERLALVTEVALAQAESMDFANSLAAALDADQKLRQQNPSATDDKQLAAPAIIQRTLFDPQRHNAVAPNSDRQPLDSTLSHAAHAADEQQPAVDSMNAPQLSGFTPEAPLSSEAQLTQNSIPSQEPMPTGPATRGSGAVACWGESLSNPDFIYNVALYDHGIFVEPVLESIAKNRKDWQALPAGARIGEGTFLPTTEYRDRLAQLKAHGEANDCVFQVRLYDADTTTKERYKTQRRLVEGHVYPTPVRQWVRAKLPQIKAQLANR